MSYYNEIIDAVIRSLSIPYRSEETFIESDGTTGKMMRVDFYIPSIKLAIEVDGHEHDARKGKDKDSSRDRSLGENGIAVLRIKNRQIDSGEDLHKIIADKCIEMGYPKDRIKMPMRVNTPFAGRRKYNRQF